jgi:dsRNA-specific ribonuclease
MVRNIGLYRRAFVHRSYIKRSSAHNDSHNVHLAHRPDDCAPLRTKSNERLEFVGDGVLECITKMYLYKRFPKEDEGFMTEKKIALVKNEHIGKLALDMNLNRWFVMSRHAEEKNTRHNVKKLGCLFEAFLGALFLDFNGVAVHDQDRLFADVFLTGPGFQVAQVFLERIFDKHVDWSTIVHVHDNYKNILQVHIQQTFKVTPHYIIHDSTSQFEMGVYLVLGEPESLAPESATPFAEYGTCDRILEHHQQKGSVFVFLGKGAHPVKKKAEQRACKKAIELFRRGA